jgi:hypothetical protein
VPTLSRASEGLALKPLPLSRVSYSSRQLRSATANSLQIYFYINFLRPRIRERYIIPKYYSRPLKILGFDFHGFLSRLSYFRSPRFYPYY